MLDRSASLVRSFAPPAVAVLCASMAWLALACAPSSRDSTPAESPPEVSIPAATHDSAVEWALAIHGGAGVMARDMPEVEKEAYLAALESALALGRERLAAGEPALDVVEAVVRQLEDEPLFNAGKGAVFTAAGRNELDAAIMDGLSGDAGAVAGITSVKNPIRLARAVLEHSRHVFLVGEGAEVFAAEVGLETVEPSWFHTDRRWQQLEAARERAAQRADGSDAKDTSTVGAVALDRDGNLAAATSTGGLTNKRFGRVGDVPILGAGTWADNATAAISCTGYGEQFIRHAVAHDVAARMAYGGAALQTAADEVIHGVLDEGDGGLIAVSHRGEIALVFNSPGMYRGAADSSGRFEVAIWEATVETPDDG
ncbi:MAG: isoaspartyl peptidase/L-asparaginase [Acidobacteriota bacterium]